MSFPKTDSELVIWLNNFANVFETHAETLGFTTPEVTALRNDTAVVNHFIGDVLPTYKAAVQSRVTYKKLIMNGPLGEQGGPFPPAPAVGAPPALVAPGIVPRLRQLIQRIQLSPAYNPALGQELGIVAPGGNGTGTPTTTPKPRAKAVALPNSHVRISFVKRNFNSIQIEGRRPDQTEWALLGIHHHSPYIDTRPPLTAGRAEFREYRLRYLDRDQPVGDYSDIISASTTP